jgi:GNAT superfamily N-acetyltransferase
MPSRGPLFRAARPEDAPAVAALHADSWRRHYRGALSDAFLDNEVDDHLGRMWTRRLAAPPPAAHTVVAEHDGETVGLAHTFLDDDPAWGAFLDNLHVRHGTKRQGIGTRLMALTAQEVLRRSPSSGLHLTVLAQNSAAQAFYEACGGTPVERLDVPAPGGNPAWLNGKPICIRYVWRAHELEALVDR